MIAAIITGIKSFFVGLTALLSSAHPQTAALTQQRTSYQNIPTISSSAPNTQSATSDVTNNWAGYAATGGTFSAVSGSWTVPKATGSGDTSADATWIGIGGVTSDDLIQVGTQNIVAANGQVTTSAFYELLPAGSEPMNGVTVHPGDSVSASLTESSSGQWTISFTDHTDGDSYSTTVPYASSQSSAEWIEEDPSDQVGEIPLDNFGTVSFSDGSTVENGSTVSISGSNAGAVTMANTEGQTLATTSALGSSGAGFSVTRSTASSGPSISQYNQNPGSWRRYGSGIGGENYQSAPTTSYTSNQWGYNYIPRGFGNRRF